MIDPLLSLTFNLHAQRGTYALLIGSGVSRAASIPTGWEVTLDLIAKLAHLQGDDCKGDQTHWYAEKYGKVPDYSELLSAVASTSAAQQQLLKAYFEPTEEEREEGKKLPTSAHRAIALLVSSGHIRVIVTTNFDRLLEAALEAEGIHPVVIASPDAAKGAPPLVHSQCTLIKVHGDYLDHRIKNSVEALSKYDKAMDRLLDQVFDEYGLIICGWSGEYDVALRKAMDRLKSRRYPMYWTGLSDPRGAAKDLIAIHNAHFMKISGADPFFSSLVDKVEALEEFDRPHPLSTQAAVVTLKRYLSEEKYRIHLRDFLVDEANQSRSSIDAAFAHVDGVAPDQQSTQGLMNELEAGCENLVHLFATGSFFGTSKQARAFFDAFHLIVPSAPSPSRYEVWVNLRSYPALLLAYAAGIAAIFAENYSVLRELASRPSIIKNNKSSPAPVRIHAYGAMERNAAKQLLEGMQEQRIPVSKYLFDHLRDALSPLIVDDALYQTAFDNFEYLWCLLCVDAQLQLKYRNIWPPFGLFFWRWDEWEVSASHDRLYEEVVKAIADGNTNWTPLKAGLFGGDVERLKSAKEYVDQSWSKTGL